MYVQVCKNLMGHNLAASKQNDGTLAPPVIVFLFMGHLEKNNAPMAQGALTK